MKDSSKALGFGLFLYQTNMGLFERVRVGLPMTWNHYLFYYIPSERQLELGLCLL